MLKLRVCVIALLACVFFAAGCSRKEEQPMTTALKYVMDGEWAKADRPSAEAIMKTPDNINALILRSLVCERLKRYDEAVENADPTGGRPYCLCVSTWGDRPLKNDNDLEFFKGIEVEVKIKKALSGKKKKFVGTLEDFDDLTVTVAGDVFERSNIDVIRPYIGF
jgi:ribosome maturation factor RimP